MRNINTGKWVELIESIAATGMYEKIIIDLSSVVADVFSILNISSKVYMPIINDVVSSMKMSAFEEYLIRSENSEIIDKIIKVKMPQFHIDIEDESFIDRQLWNEFGDYVRSVLKEAA